MRILILFTFLITNAFANELSDLKNLVVHKIPKIYDNITVSYTHLRAHET